jgi:cytochrome c
MAVLAVLAAALAPAARAVDAEAAQALIKQNNCLRCHGIEKEKEGPAFRKVAAQRKGEADAEARLVRHLTSGEMAKFPDGHEEAHKIIKARDAEQVLNLVRWILSQ